MPLQINSNINPMSNLQYLNPMVRIEMYNLQTRVVQFKDQKEAKNVLELNFP